MHRYYKISRKWAEILGVTQSAVQHPDNMYLVTPNLGLRLSEAIAQMPGGPHLLPAEAFDYIGAIGLTVAEAHASERGELRHDGMADKQEQGPEQEPETSQADEVQEAEETENPESAVTEG